METVRVTIWTGRRFNVLAPDTSSPLSGYSEAAATGDIILAAVKY